MSIDNMTCSLARLALCKAIKTPDDQDKNAEPWTKSVIFHQPHIPASMRESLQNTVSNRRSFNTNHKLVRPSSLQPSPLRNKSASSTLGVTSQIPKGANYGNLKAKNSANPANRSEQRSRDRSSQMSANNDQSRPATMYLAGNKAEALTSPNRSQPTLSYTSGTRRASRKSPQPSDDEDEEEDTDQDEETHSEDAVDNCDDFPTQDNNGTPGSDSSDSLKARYSRLRSQAQTPRPSGPKPLNGTRTQGNNKLNNRFSEPMDQWQKFTPDATASSITSSGSMSSRLASFSDSDGSVCNTNHKSRYRDTMVTDPDHFHPSQMQERVTPMPSLSYQVPRPVRTQTPTGNHHHRFSMSGIDIIMQREQEKAEHIRKPKRIDPTHAPIDGMLARVPERGQHTINFQAASLSAYRNSPLSFQQEYQLNSGKGPLTTDKEEMYSKTSKNTSRRQAETIRSEAGTPTPAPSMSSPVFGQASMIPPAMMGQFYSPAIYPMSMAIGYPVAMAMPPIGFPMMVPGVPKDSKASCTPMPYQFPASSTMY